MIGSVLPPQLTKERRNEPEERRMLRPGDRLKCKQDVLDIVLEQQLLVIELQALLPLGPLVVGRI